MRSFAFRLLVGILTLGVLELSVRVAFPFLPGFERTRLALRGGLGAASQFQNCIGRPTSSTRLRPHSATSTASSTIRTAIEVRSWISSAKPASNASSS